MMKNLLVLLLVMMLPLCAQAEAYNLSLSVDTDADLFPAYLKPLLLMSGDDIPAEEAGTYATLFQKLLDGIGLSMTFQEDAAALDVQLAGGRLMDLVLHEAEQAVYVTSSMLPGYALCDERSSSSAAEKAMSDALEAIDLQLIANSMKDALSAWLGNIEPTVSRGVFNGDAYEGGTVCTTWVISDMDIAALASALATEELRSAVTLLCAAAETDASAFFAGFDAKNDAVADADAYMYMLRLVENDAEELVGISLTVIEDIEQVATISLGLTENEAVLVVGLGLSDQNYWWQLTAHSKQLHNITYLGGSSMEWMADKSEGFPYVSATHAPVSNYTWSCNITESGSRFLWDAGVREGTDQPEAAYLMSSKGTVDPREKTLDCTIAVGHYLYAPIALNLTFVPAEPIAPFDPALKVCSTTSEADADLYAELMNKLSASLMARTLKLLPLDVILTLNQLSVPQ